MSALTPAPSPLSAGTTQAVRGRLLRFAAVTALVVCGVVHGALARSYGAGLPGITLGKQFVVQAVVALAVAGWLLARDIPLAWLAGVAVTGATLAAILLAHTGSGLPALGPIPAIREEGYDLPQLVTMAAEAVYLVLAGVRLLVPARLR
jgi:hypothetical protein